MVNSLSTSGGDPRLLLHDREKFVRAGLTYTESGDTGLYLYDGSHAERVSLALARHTDPLLSMRHTHGNNPVGLVIDREGHVRLDMFDRDSRAGFTLGMGSIGAPGFRMYDDTGVVRADLGMSATLDSPRLELYDATGRARATLGATGVLRGRSGEPETREESTLMLYNSEGTVVFESTRR